jgi:hypothetical protein
MDDQEEITKLLGAYKAKGMAADAARHSLTELGYGEEAISQGLQAANYSAGNDLAVDLPPVSSSPDWTEVGNDILNEKRSQSRTIAQGVVFLLGGSLGVRAYFLFWQTRLSVDHSCQSTSFPVMKTNTCYQQAVNPGRVVIAAIAGAVAALIIAKICYFISDKLRKRG